MVGGKGIPIWFFIGSLLSIYGIIITIANIWDFISPSMEKQIVLRELNFGILWGIILLVIGLIYFISFRHWKKNKLKKINKNLRWELK
jgi:hypothetical protein